MLTSGRCHIWAGNINQIIFVSAEPEWPRHDNMGRTYRPRSGGLGSRRAKAKAATKSKRKALTRPEQKQVRRIAKTVVKNASETKHRAFLFPKTTANTLPHNTPFFLFGDKAENGLLNTAVGDQSRPQPDGGGVPAGKPGQVREGLQIRLLSLLHKFIFSSAGISPSVNVRVIMFQYPQTPGLEIEQGDILNQPINTGAGEGWPNIILTQNKWNTKGITFLKDVTYTFSGQPTPGAIDGVEGADPNWGEGPAIIRSYHHHFGKMGRRIKYQEGTGDNSELPVKDNIGIMVVAQGNYTTPQGQSLGNFEMLGDLIFKDM